MRFNTSRHAVLFLLPLALIGIASMCYGQWVDNQASTVGESYARGMSDLVRSAGENNLLNSEAAGNYEDARKQYLENRLQATDTYFQMRSRNRAYREDERGPRPTSEELFRLAKVKAPQRLSPSELDPLSGSVVWPLVLRDDRFTPTEQKIEAMLEYWAQHNQLLTLSQYEQLKVTIDQLAAELKTAVDDSPANAYAEARHFLDSLAYEVQLSQG